uniref:Thioredoxin domain-containing protein n=1 Tax=Meloidogyne javanica TaxID=6303 RepID=A0A915M638_MELJA
MSQTIKHPKSQEELNAILAEAGSKLVVIDFFATWCGPCRLMTPKFNKLADEFVDPIYVGIDVDEHERIAANYEINVC